MKIYFRKTFKYNPCHSGLSKYESYEAVTRQQYSPGITNFDSGERFDLRTFCSSLTRGQQTAERISTVQIVKLDQLREIEFSLHNLVSKEEFESNGSSLVRERFIKSFVDDTLLEKRAEIKKRIDEVIEILLKDKNDKLVISHSFTMKMFEAYFKRALDIFENPILISEVIFPDTETYGFGGGFVVEKSL